MYTYRARQFVAHIRSSRKASNIFRQLQRQAIAAAQGANAREDGVEEEEEVDHEADDPEVPGFQAAAETPPAPGKVLELKAVVETRWSSTFYMIQRCVFMFWQ